MIFFALNNYFKLLWNRFDYFFLCDTASILFHVFRRDSFKIFLLVNFVFEFKYSVAPMVIFWVALYRLWYICKTFWRIVKQPGDPL